MNRLPDAPWIREAELNGYPPDDDPIRCPECGEDCDIIYMDDNNNVLGCDNCVRALESWEWRLKYGQV